MLAFLNDLHGFDQVPGAEPDLRWALVTLSLSLGVALGYVVIAFNWYFQSKLAARAESRAALARLSLIVACCMGFGVWFYASEMPWPAWRVYDAVLVLLVAHTWWFALRMRGVGLVNERLAEADELERSAGRYRDIAELLPHIVWTATADGVVDFSNRRWAEFAGPGRAWLDAVHPEERAEVLAWWDGVVGSRRSASREVRLGGAPGSGGGYRTFVVSASPIEHGEAVKWLGACADVEDQKRLAAEKEKQAERKTFFLNSLSHDLRAPLNNVVLNAHLLKMSARDESQVENAPVIVENAVAAGELVTRLLEAAKSDGEDGGAPDVVRLLPLLHLVARRFQPIAEQKGLGLRVVADQDVELFVDRQKLERVVANLVDNAIKFTEAGGVTVELSRAEGTRVRVCDTGIGVPDAAAPHLFDEFFQVNNHERDRTKGFGMGLAICRSLARQISGDVRLAGTGPGGSCFEIILDGCGAGAVAGGGGSAGAVAGAAAGAGIAPVVRAGGGGRPDGAAGGDADPEEAGLHRV